MLYKEINIEGKLCIAHNTNHFVLVSWKRATEVLCVVREYAVPYVVCVWIGEGWVGGGSLMNLSALFRLCSMYTVHRWKSRSCAFLGGLYGPLKSFLLCLCGVAGCCLWRHPYVAVLYRLGSEGTDESSLPEQSDQLKTLLACPPPRCGRRFQRPGLGPMSTVVPGTSGCQPCPPRPLWWRRAAEGRVPPEVYCHFLLVGFFYVVAEVLFLPIRQDGTSCFPAAGPD